jgi:hypothetical protein
MHKCTHEYGTPAPAQAPIVPAKPQWSNSILDHDLALLADLVDQRLVDVRDNTTTGDGCLHMKWHAHEMSVQHCAFRVFNRLQAPCSLRCILGSMHEGKPSKMTHLDEGVQLLITTNSQLQVAGGDTLHL